MCSRGCLLLQVFEEHVFVGSRHLVRPMQMFFWTLSTQFLLGWALYPIQTVPAFGGIDLRNLPELLRDGALCTLGHGDDCSPAHAAIFWSLAEWHLILVEVRHRLG